MDRARSRNRSPRRSAASLPHRLAPKERARTWPRRSLIIYARYDMTFLPEFSEQIVAEFARHNLDHKVVVLPYGHYTMGETPFKYMDGWQLASFLRTVWE